VQDHRRFHALRGGHQRLGVFDLDHVERPDASAGGLGAAQDLQR